MTTLPRLYSGLANPGFNQDVQGRSATNKKRKKQKKATSKSGWSRLLSDHGYLVFKQDRW